MTARFKTALLAASFFGLLTGVAAADPATVVQNTPLYASPGGFVQAVIPAGSYVDVDGCAGSWCSVNWAGQGGYVSSSLIALADVPGRAYAMVPDDNYLDEGYGPYYGYGVRYGYVHGRDHRDGRRHWQGNDGRNWQGNRGNWQRNTNGQGNRGAIINQPRQQNFGAGIRQVQPSARIGGGMQGGGHAQGGSAVQRGGAAQGGLTAGGTIR